MSFQLPDETSATALTAWYKDVLPELPGIQADLALHSIRNKLIEFCELSRILTKEVSGALVENQFEYPVLPSIDGNSEVNALVTLKLNGITLAPTSEDELNTTSSNWEAATGTPQKWFRSEFDTLRLYPIPDTENPTTTLAAGLGPADTAATVADASAFPTLAANQSFLVDLVNGAGDLEVVKVTATSGNTLTLVRAQEGTTALTLLSGDTLTLRTLKAKVAIRPTATATTISSQFFNEYRLPIAAGAKAALMMMPGKPWSNAQMGVFYGAQFQNSIDRARIQAFQSRGNLTARVKPRVFGS